MLKAIDLLCGDRPTCRAETALEISQTSRDLPGELAALGSLGDAYRMRGKADQALWNI